MEEVVIKNYLSLKKVNDYKYEVYFGENTYMGKFIQDVDGDFDFWPELDGGSWSSYILRELSQKLIELNKV